MHPVFNPVAPFDICFLPYICLWQISQIQTCLRVVVGPGLVSTSPAFMRSSGSNDLGLHVVRVGRGCEGATCFSGEGEFGRGDLRGVLVY